MPTLIRILLGVLLFVALQGVILVVVLAGPRDERGAWTAILVGAVVLTVPPFAAGIFASYWDARDGHGRRWMRIRLLVLLLLQVAGSVAVIGGSVVGGVPVLIPVLMVATGAALFPASIALGRVALRRGRTERTSGDDFADEIRSRIGTGVRNAVVGMLVGAVLGTALIVVFAVVVEGGLRGTTATSIVVFAVQIVLIGAAVGAGITLVSATSRVRALLGSDVGVARRIGRAVLGKPQDLNADEAERARRYAHGIGPYLRFQFVFSALLLSGIVTTQVGQLLSPDADHVLPAVFLGLYAAFLAVGIPFAVRQVRRVHAYAEAHPLPAE